MNFYKINIKHQIFILNAILIIISYITISAIFINIYYSSIKKDLILRAKAITDLTSNNLFNSLYQSNINEISIIGKSIRSGEDIIRLNIINADNKIMYDGTNENKLLFSDFNNNLLKKLNEKTPSIYEFQDKTLLCLKQIENSGSKLGYIFIEFSLNRMKKNIFFIYVITLFIGIGIVILLYIVSQLINNAIKPLKTVKDMLFEISRGNGDLTVHLKFLKDSKNEIDLLSQYFNDFIASLNIMIKQIKDFSINANNVSTNLSSLTIETSSSLNEITVSINGMTDKIVSLDTNIQNLNIICDSVKSYVKNFSTLIDDQSMKINDSSNKLEIISDLIKKISDISRSELDMINKLDEYAISGDKVMNETIVLIKKVVDSANIIMNLLKVINNISSQTNLLAMNASIEAAHAGAYGKGFSVVANEIRTLSESTAVNSKEITKSLKDVITNINVSEQSFAKSKDFFQNIISGIKTANMNYKNIDDLMKNLLNNNEIITSSLEFVQSANQSVMSSTKNIDEKIVTIVNLITNISNISFETKKGMEEISIGINELLKASNEISNQGVNNSNNLKDIEKLIGRFNT